MELHGKWMNEWINKQINISTTVQNTMTLKKLYIFQTNVSCINAKQIDETEEVRDKPTKCSDWLISFYVRHVRTSHMPHAAKTRLWLFILPALVVMANTTFLVILADVVGWGYFLSWTVSFLPQIYENWRRKSVVGFSFDMLAYFLLSYVTYMIYNVTVYFKPNVLGDLTEDNPVKLTDVVFSLVAFICTSFQGIQCLMYDRGSQEIHRSTVVLCICCLLALGILTVLSCFGLSSWFLVLQYCGYVKLVVSFGTVCLTCSTVLHIR